MPSAHPAVSKYQDIAARVSELPSLQQRFPSQSASELSRILVHFLLACYTNAHQASIRQDVTQYGLFEVASKMAHACSPSTVFFIHRPSLPSDADDVTHIPPFELVFVAVRDIAPGDVLTCSYLDEWNLLMPTTVRQALLFELKFFSCVCPRCSCEPTHPALVTKAIQFRRDMGLSSVEMDTDHTVNGDDEDPWIRLYAAFEVAAKWTRALHSQPRFVLEAGRAHQKTFIALYVFYACLVDVVYDTNIHPALVVRWLICGVHSPMDHLPGLLDWLSLASTKHNGVTEFDVIRLRELHGRSDDLVEEFSMAELDACDANVVDCMVGELAYRCWSMVKYLRKSPLLSKSILEEDEYVYLRTMAKRHSKINK